jgi:DnaJ-class molecular chaperone
MLRRMFDPPLWSRGHRPHGAHLRARLKITKAQAVSGMKITIELFRLECRPHCGNVCRGARLYKVKREIEISVPAGIATGQKLRLAMQGNHCPFIGEPGDLFCEIVVV